MLFPTAIRQIESLIKPGATIYVKPALDCHHVHLMVGNPEHEAAMRMLDVHVVRAGLVNAQDNPMPMDGILTRDLGQDIVSAIAKAIFGSTEAIQRKLIH